AWHNPFCSVSWLSLCWANPRSRRRRRTATRRLQGSPRKRPRRPLRTIAAYACAGLKKGPFGIDKTKALELRKLSLCETGPVVVASITVHVWCATSDKAVIPADLADDITATVSANLDTCQVLDADVSPTTFIVETGIQVVDL